MNFFISLLLFLVFVLGNAKGNAEQGKLEVCIFGSLGQNNTHSAGANILWGKVVKEIVESFYNPDEDKQFDFSLDNEVIRAEGYVKNLKVDKSVSITVCNNKIFSIQIPQNITINSLKIHADEYYLNGTVADIFCIFGKGELDITLEGLTLEIINFSIEFLHLGCFRMDLNVKLSSWTANFGNLMDGDDLLEPTINAIVGDMGPDIIDYLWSSIYTDILAPIIQKILDKYINHRDGLEGMDYKFLKQEEHFDESDSDICKTYDVVNFLFH